MPNSTTQGIVLGAALALLAACGSSSPVAPSATEPPVVARPPTVTAPALSGPFRTFVFDRELFRPVNGYTRQSQFLLYDNGGFALKYLSLGGEYRGTYKEKGSAIIFEWEGWSAAGPWGAAGILENGTLTVRYNEIMQMTDFDDGVYVQAP